MPMVTAKFHAKRLMRLLNASDADLLVVVVAVAHAVAVVVLVALRGAMVVAVTVILREIPRQPDRSLTSNFVRTLSIRS